jgi:AhpD family alkylhydroperoxidase
MTANDLFAAAPELMKKWTATSLAVASSLDPALIPLVEIRASQINGCANCINMHAAEARAKGETEQRIYLLPAWRDAPCYTDRERAALGWTEALTRRKCASPKTTRWLTHSRRIDPISLSAKPFCQGEPGAMGLSRPSPLVGASPQRRRPDLAPGSGSAEPHSKEMPP